MHPAPCTLHRLALSLLIAIALCGTIIGFCGTGVSPVVGLCGTGVSPVTATVTHFAGKVVAVHDGDTISVLVPAGTVVSRATPGSGRGTGVSPVLPSGPLRTIKVRLEGIDCPELAQPYGKAAKLFTSERAFGKQVQAASTTVDRYGRIVGRVTVDGRDLSEQIVSAGLAWHYTEYSRDLSLDAAEREARASRRGLWVQANPVPPWVYRRGTRPATSAGTGTARPPTARPAPRAGPVNAAGGPFHGNTSSRVFHAPGCPNYNCKNCTAIFATREQALAAGYKPAGDCQRK